MDPNALELGWLQTVLDEADSESGSSSIAKRGELYRRMILNGTTIDSNGFIDFNATKMNVLSFEVFEADGNVVVSGLFGAFGNTTANVINFVANVVTFGSNTTFVRNVELQAGASLVFSGNTAAPDVTLQRVSPGQLLFSSNVAVNGAVNVASTLQVSGAASLGNTTIVGTLASGNTAVSGTLTAGNTTTETLSSGNTAVSGTLTAGNTTVSGTLGAGNTTTGTLASGNTTVSGTLASGNTAITGTATVSGNTTMNGNAYANAQLHCDTTNGRLVIPVGSAKYAT